MSESDKSSESSDNQHACPICLNDIIENNNYAITSCGHKFCFNCIIQSLQTIYTCPICRETLIVNNENENSLNLTLTDRIFLYFRRICTEGFTNKELLYSIILLLSYQNYYLIQNNFIKVYYFI